MRQCDGIDEIVDFVSRYYSSYNDKDLIRLYISEHIKYKTCLIYYNEFNTILAVCRWNISDDGKTAYILDLIIHPAYRRDKRLLYMLLGKGLRMYPQVTSLTWKRENKYPERDKRTYSVRKLLRRTYGKHKNIRTVNATGPFHG